MCSNLLNQTPIDRCLGCFQIFYIKNRFIRSFLHYVPVACLTAMTFPAILYTTENMLSGLIGLAVAVILALKNKSLIVVASASCVAVFVVEQLIRLL